MKTAALWLTLSVASNGVVSADEWWATAGPVHRGGMRLNVAVTYACKV